MAITFPASPSDGDVFTNATTGVKYIYNATDGVWKTHVWPTNTNYLQLSGGTLTGNLSLGTNDLTAQDITTTGAVSVGTGLTVGNGLTVSDGNVVMANGHGIDFSATADTSASGAATTSELLDDYEEGTWTPEFRQSTSYSGQVYGSRSGRYVKIGQQVILTYSCDLSTQGTFNGSFPKIGGFPYNVSSDINTISSGSAYFLSLGVNVISINHQLHEGTDSAFYWSKSAASASREYAAAMFASGTSITGTIVYRTT